MLKLKKMILNLSGLSVMATELNQCHSIPRAIAADIRQLQNFKSWSKIKTKELKFGIASIVFKLMRQYSIA